MTSSSTTLLPTGLAALAALFSLSSPPASAQESAPSGLGRATFAWGDWNGDGARDVLVLEPGAPARLLAWSSSGFADVTVESGLGDVTGVRQALWQDYDGDGREDLLLVVPEGRSRLLKNGAAGTFAEAGAELGLDEPVFFAEWIDVEPDGHPDLLLGTRSGDRLFVNHGAEGFVGEELTSTVRSTLAAGGAGAQALANLCAGSLQDAFTGACIEASSLPVLGMLYPLGPNWMVDGAGRVGIGTITPGAKLDVVGDVRASGRLVSTAPSGAPLQVASSGLVTGLNADLLDGLHASSFSQLGSTIGSSELENGAVITSKIANGAVTSVKIAPGAVDSTALADGAVTTAKVVDGALTSSKYAPGSVDSAALATGSVTSVEILDHGVKQIDIAPGAVGTSEIATGGVTTSDIAPNAVTTSEIAPETIQDVDIATGAVTTSEVLDGTLGAQDLGILSGSGSSLGVVRVQGTGTTATALVGTASSSSGLVIGLRGTALSTSGRGVMGDASATVGATYGVYGSAASTSGTGVFGSATSTLGVAYGVTGRTNTPSGAGVYGYVDATTGGGFGVLGETRGNSSGAAVQGSSLFSSGASDGVRGQTDSSSGYAVWGVGNVAGARGVVGQAPSGTSAVHASGDLNVTGAKSFVAPHPGDPSKEIHFACLEGDESGTYFRGSSELTGGVAVIEVPEDFRMVSVDDHVTVQLTPYGPARLWIESKDAQTIVVRGDLDVSFDYMVNGRRRGFEDFRTVRDNASFVPRYRGVAFGAELPDELRDVLVQNGILNADYTPNEATAAALGWKLVDPTPEDRTMLLEQR